MQTYRFRPGLTGTLLTLVATATFVGLCLWQLGRADEKEALQALMDHRMAETSVSYTGGPLDMAQMQYRQLSVTGHFDVDHQVLLDNIIRNGKPGYEVITPLQLDSGQWLLVNRGWVPQGQRRDILPVIDTPSGTLTLHGRADKPHSKPVVGGPTPLQDNTNRWLYLDTDFFSQHTGLTVQPFLLLLDADSPAGFDRQWPVYDAKVGMHIGYAIQWGAFALIAFGTWLGLSIKRNKTDS